MKNTRLAWIDSIRALAALWIFIVHYIDAYLPELFVYWEKGGLFCGITGKLGVSVFAVLLGYFAASFDCRRQSLSTYAIKRYLQFALALFIVTALTAAEGFVLGSASANELIKSVLSESFLLSQRELVLCPQAWCMGDFMLASLVIAVLSGKRHGSVLLLSFAALMLMCGKVWIFACLIGSIVFHIAQSGFRFKSRIVKLLLPLLCLVLIRREESYITYVIDAIGFSLMLLLFISSSRLQKLFSCKPLSALGKVSFEFFLLSDLVYAIVHKLSELLLASYISATLLFWMSMLLSAAAIAACAFVLHRVLCSRPIKLLYGYACAER